MVKQKLKLKFYSVINYYALERMENTWRLSPDNEWKAFPLPARNHASPTGFRPYRPTADV